MFSKWEMSFKHIVLIFIIIFVLTQADVIDEQFRILLNSKEIKCNHNRSLNLDVSGIRIYFYDFINKVNVTSPTNNAAQLIRNSDDLDFNRRLIVFVPGYNCNIKRDLEELIRQTFKNVPNIYLVIVDHSAYTYENEERMASYLRSVEYSYYIGLSLGLFLSDLSNVGFQVDNIHCIGHSLGGHILGYAAEVFQNMTNDKLSRVTGLDPAGPCFTDSPIEHLRSGIAKYVDVYHCNAGYLGTARTFGDTDFFFNHEGKIQPNCDKGSDILETLKCYHKACVRYWAETVHDQELYVATACTSYEAFAEGLCENNNKTIAGYFNPGVVRGNYYVITDSLTLQTI